MARFIKCFFILAFVVAMPALADDMECRITDASTDADLDNAGTHPRCPQSSEPWACYCEYKEVCQGSGQTMTFKRRQFLGCGQLSDCNFSSSFGRECAALED